jgi:hypothetical protein
MMGALSIAGQHQPSPDFRRRLITSAPPTTLRTAPNCAGAGGLVLGVRARASEGFPLTSLLGYQTNTRSRQPNSLYG